MLKSTQTTLPDFICLVGIIKMKIVGIYLITCTVNGRKYVGQSLDIKRRFRQHKRKQQNPKFKQDVDKYGIEAFKFEILEECKEENLTEREDYYLDLIKPYYNIKTEGNAISEEARQKLSKMRIGKKRPEISKSVKCVETGEIFPSVRAASESCKVAISNMTMLLHGKGRTLGGFHWIFYDPENEAAELERIRQMPEGRKNTPEAIERMRQAKLGKVLSAETREKMRQSQLGKRWKESTYKKLSREIRCIETGEIFPSIKTAAEKYNIKPPNISAVLAGKKVTAGGLR